MTCLVKRATHAKRKILIRYAGFPRYALNDENPIVIAVPGDSYVTTLL